jgi:hypothetical protein
MRVTKIDGNRQVKEQMADQGRHNPGRQANRRGMGLLSTVSRPDRQLGVDAANDLGGGDDVVQAPAMVVDPARRPC